MGYSALPEYAYRGIPTSRVMQRDIRKVPLPRVAPGPLGSPVRLLKICEKSGHYRRSQSHQARCVVRMKKGTGSIIKRFLKEREFSTRIELPALIYFGVYTFLMKLILFPVKKGAYTVHIDDYFHSFGRNIILRIL